MFVSLDMSRRGPGRFPRADWRPEFASSDPLTLRVGALPREGRPDGFSGLVGRFEVATRADRTEVDVGDPIELEIVVRGSAALARIPTPDLEGAGAFADAFQVSDAPEPRRRGDGFVVFRKIVRPLRDDIDAIPSVELPYFDTDSGRYGLARSRPIPLRVNRTRRVTLTDAVGAEGAAAGATLGDGAAGLAHNYGVEDGGLVGAPRGAGDVLASPVWIGALAAPPAAYALALCGVLVRRRSASGEAARRRRSALPRARAALARAGDTSEIAEAVFAYAREATGRDAPGMTPGDAEEAIAALSGAEAAAGVRAALDRCDAGRYAGAASSEAGRLRDEALEAIERADRASRGKGGGLMGRTLRAIAPLAALLASAVALAGPMAESDARDTLRRANEASVEGLRARADDGAASAAALRESVELLDELIAAGAGNEARLRYNRANALMGLGELGRAIAEYRRAERLAPLDARLAGNLAYARSRVATRFDDARPALAWHERVPASWRAGAAVGLGALGWGLLGLRLTRVGPRAPRSLAAALVVLGAAPVASLAAQSLGERSGAEAVIVADRVVGRLGPDGGAYKPSFAEPLREGVELRVEERRPGWAFARLPDGRTTWLPESSIEAISWAGGPPERGGAGAP